MNEVRWLLLILAAAFVLLLPVSRTLAVRFGRLAVLLIVGTVIMLPFVWLVCASFKDKDVLNEYTFLPPPGKVSAETINLDNFRNLFADKQTVQGPVSFWRYALNSVFLASAGTFLSLVFSSMGGYALAKYRFRGRALTLTFMLASLTIPSVALLAPNYEVIWRLGWMDTYKALLVPSAVTVFGIFLFRQAILRVPDDVIEAGRIDGCSEFRIYLTVVMPLVRPMTAAYVLISFLGAWNAFLGPNIFLQTQRKLTLPVVLAQYIVVYQQQYGVFLAGTLLAIIPPAVLFLILQREFISGLTSGAVKQ
jgi:ABC-type glycerol-3-phosphate transport system permease component